LKVMSYNQRVISSMEHSKTDKTSKKPSRQPLGHLVLEKSLRADGFRGDISVSADLLDKYATDESIFSIRPQVVIQPKDTDDVAIAVKIVNQEVAKFPSLSLTPRAAGTGLGGGSLTDSVVIDVNKYLNRILRVGRTNDQVTFTAESGAWWRDVEAELKKYDSYLPPYPASKQICTIGGAVANNAAGPDSLRYGHVANWIESLEVVLHDGNIYNIKPLTYSEFQKLIKEKSELAKIAKKVFNLIEKNESLINKSEPKEAKNNAGYLLWDVLDTTVAEFKAGSGSFDLTRLLAGSQGTIGIITKVTMRTAPISHDIELIVLPVFNLASAGKVVLEANKYQPINVEVFDAFTYQAALSNPDFFHNRIKSKYLFQRVIWAMNYNYKVRWKGVLPEFVMLVTLDRSDIRDSHNNINDIVTKLKKIGGDQVRLVKGKYDREMFWQIRDASYLLSKLLDPNKRPAAFLEDMAVPPEYISKFFNDIKHLLKKYKVQAAVHGHGGNAHFHFYPLLDFTQPETRDTVMKMADDFFAAAVKYGGSICGEHNDGIIRTPYLDLMYSKKTLELFKEIEHIFDPHDIFNPGKKVNPRFDVRDSIRSTN